jgi:cation:H+ antiporter
MNDKEGSNIFNILGIVGAAGLIAPDGIVVAPSVLRFNLPKYSEHDLKN